MLTVKLTTKYPKTNVCNVSSVNYTLVYTVHSQLPNYLLSMYAKSKVTHLCHTCAIKTRGELKLDTQPELELSPSTSPTNYNNELCSVPRSSQQISGLAHVPSAPRISQREETVIQKPTAPTSLSSELNLQATHRFCKCKQLFGGYRCACSSRYKHSR